ERQSSRSGSQCTQGTLCERKLGITPVCGRLLWAAERHRRSALCLRSTRKVVCDQQRGEHQARSLFLAQTDIACVLVRSVCGVWRWR
ncbi:unnamed protein product, partial [Ectocarpus sp. 4 AP-2014]